MCMIKCPSPSQIEKACVFDRFILTCGGKKLHCIVRKMYIHVMYLLIVLDALGSFSINVKQHEINWTNFRQQLIFFKFDCALHDAHQ